MTIVRARIEIRMRVDACRLRPGSIWALETGVDRALGSSVETSCSKRVEERRRAGRMARGVLLRWICLLFSSSSPPPPPPLLFAYARRNVNKSSNNEENDRIIRHPFDSMELLTGKMDRKRG